MPRKKGLNAEVRRMASTARNRRRPARNLPTHLSDLTLYDRLRSITDVLYEVKTECLVCPPDPDAPETVSAGPCGPADFAETVATDTEPARVLSWPNSPERFAQACLNAARQNINNVNTRDNTIRTGPEPAQSYAPDDRNLFQWGICTDCRRILSHNYASDDRDKSDAALLRWGLAAYLGRNLAGSRWQDHQAIVHQGADPNFGALSTSLAEEAHRSRMNLTHTERINRLNQDLRQILESAAVWRRSGLTTDGLVLRRAELKLPIRIAGYVATWIGLTRTVDRIAVVAIFPQPAAEPTNGTTAYPHRCVVGMPEEPGAATTCEQFLEHGRRDMSRSIHKWLPEVGAKWEHLYLSPVDYANRKRVSPKARQLMQAACGKRMAVT